MKNKNFSIDIIDLTILYIMLDLLKKENKELKNEISKLKKLLNERY